MLDNERRRPASEPPGRSPPRASRRGPRCRPADRQVREDVLAVLDVIDDDPEGDRHGREVLGTAEAALGGIRCLEKGSRHAFNGGALALPRSTSAGSTVARATPEYGHERQTAALKSVHPAVTEPVRRAEATAPRPQSISADQRQRLVAETAYYKSQRRGPFDRDPHRDWFEAEAEVDARLVALRSGTD